MNIKITKVKPDASQEFFAQPLDHEQKVEVKKLHFVEQILRKMEDFGLKRKDIADKMKVAPARVTKMLRGTENMTMDTLIRSADAVECELYFHIAPKGKKVIWKEEGESQVYPLFMKSKRIKESKSTFNSSVDIAINDIATAS